ncbi:MAG: mitochondrial fission ELM1 family protein [Aestuariivirga sp.]|nr:mitochondrial fission ELM1 family protein [Aestuariivirga sp.]
MAADPLVWILSGGRKGDLDQMLALARATGWRHEVKQATRSLAPPWPDLLLCAEASASRLALRIKRLAEGRTRAVCLGRPAGATRGFDLVITTAQYRIPAAPNVVEIGMPLSAAREGAGPAAPDGPVALLVGGPAFPDLLDGAAAARLAAEALAYAARRGHILSVQTSPRTPPNAIRALEAAIRPPHRLAVFGAGENRYADLLAEASEIVVTSDSVSMLSDALASARPVSVYPLPQALNLKWRAGEWLFRSTLAPVRWLFDAGLIEAAADRRRLHARLVAERRLVPFGEEPLPPLPGASGRDLETAVQSLRALMAGTAYHE